MNKLKICKEWEEKYMHEVLPAGHWRTLLSRLAGPDPYDHSGHHEMCLIAAGRADECGHCKQLFAKEKV